ncbi:hypothetical protein EVAR_60609_1 [Eumeta japonica]|uniref:Uncharacterized protein n=1 Tax=Eumeta variegata TaxID=151549 RepID=A0A4C1YGA7_EUMVA|nr:hypothetical protein EVAR_60609_1 [Eumeta japonica]
MFGCNVILSKCLHLRFSAQALKRIRTILENRSKKSSGSISASGAYRAGSKSASSAASSRAGSGKEGSATAVTCFGAAAGRGEAQSARGGRARINHPLIYAVSTSKFDSRMIDGPSSTCRNTAIGLMSVICAVDVFLQFSDSG